MQFVGVFTEIVYAKHDGAVPCYLTLNRPQKEYGVSFLPLHFKEDVEKLEKI